MKTLLQNTLLTSKYRSKDWTDWFEHHGVQSGADKRWLAFESSILTFHAAIEALGIAMGQTALLSAEFKTGVLIKPFDMPLRREQLQYWIIWPAGRRLSPEARRFVDWIIAHAESERKGTIVPPVRGSGQKVVT